MAFTSPELVRAHLATVRLGESRISDLPVVLSGTAPSQLPHAGLVEGSGVVKCRRASAPTRETPTLADAWVSLSHTCLIPTSVVIAGDSSLGTVYRENVDYVVDYAAGRVKRVAGGSISSGQTVVTWFEYYHVFIAGDDYAVNAASGQLVRRSTGAIADGQTVVVDYAVALGAVSDAVIEQALNEAGEAVLAMIDPAYQDQPAPAIVIGATHWTVAAVARMRAVATLADAGVNAAVARSAAQVWLDVADRYERTGRQYLSRFAAPVPTLETARRR